MPKDLRRHIAGMPILAKNSTTYRMRKFVRRHAVVAKCLAPTTQDRYASVVSIVSTAAVILLLGMMLGYVAQRDRAAAHEAARAAEFHNFVYQLLVTANPEYTGNRRRPLDAEASAQQVHEA